MQRNLLDKYKNFHCDYQVSVSAPEFNGENVLSYYLSTTQLDMQPCSAQDFEVYQAMVGNADAMQLYGLGAAWTPAYTLQRLNAWQQLWATNNPYSGFKLYNKDGVFVGHAAYDYDDSAPPACAEISYIVDKRHWHHGYASEATSALVNHYSQRLISDGYLCRGETLAGSYATARPDNPASLAVLLKAGMQLQQQDLQPINTQWGQRFTFFKATDIADTRVEYAPLPSKLN